MSKDLSPYELVCYADINFVGNPKDWNLVISYYFFLNKSMVFWYIQKQRIVSTLTTKAEYIALGHTAKKTD